VNSTFKRKPYVRPPKAPLVKLERPPLYALSSVVVVACPKEVLIDCRPYRIYVATHACFFCGVLTFSQCAHENLGKGKGIKVCDSRTFPACGPHWGLMGCHYAFDNYVDFDRDESRVVGAQMSARMRGQAEADGWRFTGTEILRP
jgi:hypothetical protein